MKTKIALALLLALGSLSGRAETFLGPTTASNRLLVPANSAIIITATLGNFTNSTQVAFNGGYAFTQSYFAPLANGTTYAVAGPVELIFTNSMLFTFYRLTNSTITTLAVGYDPIGIPIPTNKTMHFFGVPDQVFGSFSSAGPNGGWVSFTITPNSPAEFTGPGTVYLNSGVFPPLGKFISYYFADDGLAVSDQRAIVGPTGSLAVIVEKSTDLKAWSPVLMQNTSDPVGAFYRVRIQH
jgi:hypothetical protein